MVERTTVMDAMHAVIDPELGLDAVELGMVGEIEVDGADVLVNMRLTSMSCPFWQLFVEQVKGAVGDVDGVRSVEVRFDRATPWSPDLMSEAARKELETVGLMPPRFRQPGAGEPARSQLIQLMSGVLEKPPPVRDDVSGDRGADPR